VKQHSWFLAALVGWLATDSGAWAEEAAAGFLRDVTGPLVEYVGKEDASYRWTEKRKGQLGGTQFVELRLVSQTWRDIPWKHQLFLLKPSTATKDATHGLLFIGGGSWRPEYDSPDYEQRIPGEAHLLAAAAEQLKSPVAILLHVPHQPILDGKHEDAAIAYTFEQFLRTGEKDWPLLLPMVKSAVRGMDATQEYAKENWSMDLKAFTVTGASKRGWTTWLTGAVDRLAMALAPMVIDVLNMPAQMKHQVATWGDYSEQIGDYTERGLQKHLSSEDGKELTQIVDPYAYRQGLTQPKLLLFGTNDRYWPLDACNLYWDDLPGEKHLLYIPNNGHGIKDYPRIIGALVALHQQTAGGKQLPQLSWKYENGDGKLRLRVSSVEKPSKVQAWVASSPTRDFRNAEWTTREVQVNGEGYSYDLPLPEKGYRAVFGEAVYENGDAPSLYLSTNVRIVAPGQDVQAAQ
jgi:PhoPQ-activated pathogenicity-related protein